MLHLHKMWNPLRFRTAVFSNIKYPQFLRLFWTQDKDATQSVLSDIEKGGTFDARKRVPKIITNELKTKIKDHVSNSSSGEYLSNFVRHKNIIKETLKNKSPSNSAQAKTKKANPMEEKDEYDYSFRSEFQESLRNPFSGDGSSNSSSPFKNRSKKDITFVQSRSAASIIKKIASK